MVCIEYYVTFRIILLIYSTLLGRATTFQYTTTDKSTSLLNVTIFESCNDQDKQPLLHCLQRASIIVLSFSYHEQNSLFEIMEKWNPIIDIRSNSCCVVLVCFFLYFFFCYSFIISNVQYRLVLYLILKRHFL